ncbi:aldo/keto reductase [Carnobacterium viridans]|uniref:Aldo/keto reductase n=1 Tax=Carnobacterium viridans TaxID=174587 RepID=A0A1H0Y944_9LACT|nr:aldo/keto reductase [Carnobacterium viridans]UDE95268.1 aldo/keto reductase [Carnobacterium viridans]SDQ11729.1 Aldo/keto reductase [Carnobacterium viridans]
MGEPLVESIELYNGVKIPKLGLGLFLMKNEAELVDAVKYAVEVGYRHFDTAKIYGNEKYLARGLKEAGINREEVFITSKVWNYDQGYEQTKAAFQESLDRLDTDYLDLYLIHWAAPKYVETWKAIVELYEEGKIKAIGVSNFQIHHLEELKNQGLMQPMINQIETHPEFPQNELHEYMKANGIIHEAWGPLGQGKSDLLNHPILLEIGQKYFKTPAQVIIRWHLERGEVVIPKSVHDNRILENSNVFNFSLTTEEMEQIKSLETGIRYGSDPDDQERLLETSVRPV